MSTLDNKKFEDYFEYVLSMHEVDAFIKQESAFLKLMIDDMYLYERQNASKKCDNKSMGFSYIIEEYRNYEKCLDLFSTRMIEEVLRGKENTEGLIHEKYKSFEEFMGDNPNELLYSLIEKYDEDLAHYVRVNGVHIEYFNNYKDYIITNWANFEKNRTIFNELVEELDCFYDDNFRRGKFKRWSRPEIYIYLFKKNEMLDSFEKYYEMEDTTFEEKKNMIKSSDVFTKIMNIEEIKLISEMDKMIKRKLYKRDPKNLKRPR